MRPDDIRKGYGPVGTNGPKELPPLVVTKDGVPMADQAEGIRQFKAACRRSYFPGTASMFASQHNMAVTEEWMRGWNACLDELDRKGVFRE